jgi:hypothetical protein
VKSALPHLSDQVIAEAVAKHNCNVEATLGYLASDAAREAIAKFGRLSSSESTSIGGNMLSPALAGSSNRHIRSDSAMERILAGTDLEESRPGSSRSGATTPLTPGSGPSAPGHARRPSTEPTMGTVIEGVPGDMTPPALPGMTNAATDTSMDTAPTSRTDSRNSRSGSRSNSRRRKKKGSSNHGSRSGSRSHSRSNSRGQSATRHQTQSHQQQQPPPHHRTSSRSGAGNNTTTEGDTTEFTESEWTDAEHRSQSRASATGGGTGSRPTSSHTRGDTTPGGTHRVLPSSSSKKSMGSQTSKVVVRSGSGRLTTGQPTVGGGVVASSNFSSTRHQRVLGPDPDDDMAPWAPSTTGSTSGSGTPHRPTHPIAATPAAAAAATNNATTMTTTSGDGSTPQTATGSTTDDNKYPLSSDMKRAPAPRRRTSVELEPDEAFMMKEHDSDSSDDDMRAHARRLAAMVKSLRPGSGKGAPGTNRSGTGSGHTSAAGTNAQLSRDSTSRLAQAVLGAVGSDVPGSEQWQWRHGRSSSMPVFDNDILAAAALAAAQQQLLQHSSPKGKSGLHHGASSFSSDDNKESTPRFPNAEAAQAALIAARTAAAAAAATSSIAQTASGTVQPTPPTTIVSGKLRQRSLRAAGIAKEENKEHDPDGIAAPGSNIHSTTSHSSGSTAFQPRPPSVPRIVGMDEKQIDAMLGLDFPSPSSGVISAAATTKT